MQALVHRHAQFEGDAERTTGAVRYGGCASNPVKLPSTSDDSSSGVQEQLQLVSRSSRRVREQCVAVIYPYIPISRATYRV